MQGCHIRHDISHFNVTSSYSSPFHFSPFSNGLKASPSHQGNSLCNGNRRGFSTQSVHCKSSFEAEKLGAGGPTEIYINNFSQSNTCPFTEMGKAYQYQHAKPATKPTQFQQYCQYNMVLLIHFTLIVQILISPSQFGFLSHHKGHKKGNKTATGAKILHITFQHSSYNSHYFSASLHFSQS